MTIYLVSLLAVIGLVQTALVWQLLRGLSTLQRNDDRLSHLSDALSMLAETTETGFRNVAFELDRRQPAAPAQPAASRLTTRQLVTAARRGASVHEIAAAEQVSEGEVRLRLRLDQHAREKKKTSAKSTAADRPAPAAVAKGPKHALRS